MSAKQDVTSRLVLCLHFKKENREGQDNSVSDSIDLMNSRSFGFRQSYPAIDFTKIFYYLHTFMRFGFKSIVIGLIFIHEYNFA